MICPECQITFNRESWRACPNCGAGGPERARFNVMKTSTILISVGAKEGSIYNSVEEVPEPLRRKLLQSTTGVNSGTIFIADQRGREEIAKAIRNLPQSTQAESCGVSAASPLSRWRTKSGVAFGLLLAAFAGAVMWLVSTHNW